MAWIYLIIAGLLEIGWPIGLKIAGNIETRIIGTVIAITCITGSGIALWIAQKSIPMGTAYAVWTGIGAAGAFIVGILFYNDAITFWRTIGVLMIIAGVITLKLASQ
ncbi:quaternary ammonium compound-resistance protein SugE [Bisgaardia hudsonensis]|uniref:Guanidinium exporter n=1 Tax=Bisgaardia hudsonensis TaxID=109472 RepID=A0A4R2MWE1_9PAST|nr:multidrug efflux SMR transporter [Bisgaardia hudsonensis]QLB13819.1 hypothetical protein A6A11_09460 [Bisgaardia hudsonensis]TCP11697.1 quaternary ammonium compound-resistance protein SugE [Bisgaardia hudsonensis]